VPGKGLKDAVTFQMAPRAARAAITLPASYRLNGRGLEAAVLIPSITTLMHLPTQCRYLWITDKM